MKSKEVLDDVFEAIRNYEPTNPILALKDGRLAHWQRNREYQVVSLGNGYLGTFPINFIRNLYRGENQIYDKCLPSIYRHRPNDFKIDVEAIQELVMIDSIKIIELEVLVEDFPQVKYAEEDFCKVDYEALAQHYGLNTKLIDLTADIVTAAFFATHYYNHEDGEYYTRENGVGCIRQCVYFEPTNIEERRFKVFGLQPFERPGQQNAFAISMKKDEDFARLGSKVFFRHDPIMNNMIRELFYKNNKNILFPHEEITNIASQIKNGNRLSKTAVERYCDSSSCDFKDIMKILTKHDYIVSDDLSYKLSRQLRRNYERTYKGRPYGDIVRITVRLAFTPE